MILEVSPALGNYEGLSWPSAHAPSDLAQRAALRRPFPKPFDDIRLLGQKDLQSLRRQQDSSYWQVRCVTELLKQVKFGVCGLPTSCRIGGSGHQCVSVSALVGPPRIRPRSLRDSHGHQVIAVPHRPTMGWHLLLRLLVLDLLVDVRRSLQHILRQRGYNLPNLVDSFLPGLGVDDCFKGNGNNNISILLFKHHIS